MIIVDPSAFQSDPLLEERALLAVDAELLRQMDEPTALGLYFRDDGATWCIDGDVDMRALVRVVIKAATS